MKKNLVSLLLAAVMVVGGIYTGPATELKAATPFDGEEWYDQIETVQVNREPAHTFFIPYQDAETALENEHSALTRDFSVSEYYRSLNGEWDFKWVSKPAERIEGFESPNFDISGWDKIPVPQSWQTVRDENGYPKYDLPVYSNTRYPWRNFESLTLPGSSTSTETVYAPLVYNPVGHYRKTFTVPENWDGREVFVSFQGVESCLYLYVNGQYVGYATDSFTAKDFNITKYLQPGENLIAAQVYRFSIGSYLENQDRIAVSGISRDVFLYSKDKVEVRDLFVKTNLVAAGQYDDFKLEVEAAVRNFGAAAGNYTVQATLKNMDDSDVWTDGPLVINAGVTAAGAEPTEINVSGSKDVIAPQKWFADTPNLYKLLIELKNPSGDVVETIVQRVGFRVIERNKYDGEKSVMQINGEDIMLRGVNRNEFSPDYGGYLPEEDIINDLYLMKQNNINALRMSHFPNNVITYDLADELGLYVCDEANIESHEGSTGFKPIPSAVTPGMNWTSAVMDRGKNMLERDKNHASVVIWSYGNENTYGTYTLNDDYTFYTLSNWIKQRDPGRMRKYERDNRDGFVDIYSVQYPTPAGAASAANNTNMPYIMSEYAHSMGNAPGSFVEFWDQFRAIRNAQGGFIWDFADQAIWMPTVTPPATYTVTSNKPVIAAVVKDGAINETGGVDGGKALNGYLTHDVSPDLNINANQATVEAWVLPRAIAGNAEIVSKGENGFALKYNGSNNFEFWMNGYGAGYINAAPPTDWLNGEWKQLTAVYDGTAEAGQRYKLYIDGELYATANRSSSVVVDNNVGLGLTVGNSPSYPDARKFPGQIDNVRIYNRALTADEIKDTTRGAGDANVIYWNDFESVTSEEPIEFDETTYFAYGGDWGETVHDGSFCANGIMTADRQPKPFVTAMKYAHQEIWYTATKSQLMMGQVQIANEFLNTNLNEYAYEWWLTQDGITIDSGTFDLDVAALSSKVVTIPELLTIAAVPGAEYMLNLRAKTTKDEVWAAAGHVIATEQFELPINVADEENVFDADALPEFKALSETETAIVAEGEDFTIEFDKEKAEITSIVKDGKELIASGPIIAHWRAPGDNDRNYNSALKDTWGKATVNSVETALDETGKIMAVTVASTLADSATNETIYRIMSNGEIGVTNKLTPYASGGNLLRVGMSMKLAADIRNIEYYGRGPVENYLDRKIGAHVGIYQSTTDDEVLPYIRPQFYGNHSDVRWYSVTDDAGNGLLVNGTDLISASALNYDDLEFDGIKHMYLAPESDMPVLNIDLAQAPLGSAACGPLPLDKYILHPTETYEYTYRIMPITAADTEDKIAAAKTAFDDTVTQSGGDIGAVIKTGDSRIDAQNGSSGGVGSASFGTIINYDETIGLFYPEGANVGAISYINGLDNPAGDSVWKGYLDITVNTEAAGKYSLNILCANSSQPRLFEATINGVSQGSTPTIADSIQYTAGNAGLKVLTVDVVLENGVNSIRLQAPAGLEAPNFYALCVTESGAIPYLSGKVEWVGSSKTANPNMVITTGTSVSNPTAISPVPALEEYDDVIAWFFPDMDQSPTFTATAGGRYYINGIDNSESASWDGSVTVTVSVPESGFYTLYDLVATGSSYVGRTHEFTVNGVSQGHETYTSGQTVYTTGTGVAVLSKAVQLEEGENTVKIQALSGTAAPAFVALAVVGYDPAGAPIGEIMTAGGEGVELRQGLLGALTSNGTFGNMQNFDANTVGMFLPDIADGSPIIYNRVNGLDSSANYWRGHVNLFVNADTAGEYALNVLCSTGETGRKYDVTVNGGLQAQTTAASNDMGSPSVYSTSASQAVNVVTALVTLNEGLNVIRLQAPADAAAPNFMAAVLTEPVIVVDYGINDIILNDDGTVSVAVNSEYDGQLILASYDADDQLIAAAAERLAAGDGRYTFELDLTNETSITAFAWSDGYVPLYPSFTVADEAVEE